MTSESRRFVENLSADLRLLSTEAKKKHNHVKEAAEAGLVKVRNISSASSDAHLVQNLRAASSELIHPLMMACGTRNARLVQIALVAIQRLVQYRTLEPITAPVIVNELWQLMESECEELRVLQTLTLLVSTELLVIGSSLAKCLAICFRLNFAKDPIVINTACASVRQLIHLVFERVVQEDAMKCGDLPIVAQQALNTKEHAAPPTLRPCAADAYLLFRDMCKLINAENPVWLVGICEMTRTLGLELLEAMLVGYPTVFIKHGEFAQLVKEQVCPLVIKLFSPNLKYIQITSQHPHSPSSSRATSQDPATTSAGVHGDRPYFPIAMRLLRVVVVLVTNLYTLLVTECEIFLSLILKFLESDKLLWQRALALEVLHRILSQSHLLIWFCENYDRRPNSTRIVQSALNALNAFVQTAFNKGDANHANTAFTKDDDAYDGAVQAIGQPGFHYHGVFIPLHSNICSSKSLILDMLDKHDPPTHQLSDGYCLSLAYACVVDCTRSLHEANDPAAMQATGARANVDAETLQQLFTSTQISLLSAVAFLLDASIDETINETLLKCLSHLVHIACSQHSSPAGGGVVVETAFYALCRVALPVAYLARVAGIQPPSAIVYENNPKALSHKSSETFESDATTGQPNQVVAVGTTCPTPSTPLHLLNTPVMLSSKNVQSARVLIAVTEMNGALLGDCWHLILATLQHLVWILGMRPIATAGGAFRTGVESASGGDSQAANVPTVLTTAVMADVAVMSSMLNHLFDSTRAFDDVALHHVIAGLCKLSSEAMMVSQNGVREPSYFAVGKLLQTGIANLNRLEIYWKPLTAHLIEVCSHSYAKLREWGAIALTTLVRNGLTTKTTLDELKRQQLVLAPLTAMCECDAADVRRRQIDCLMQILQCEGEQLRDELWPMMIHVIEAVVTGEHSVDDALIKQSYQVVHLIVTDFLDRLPLSCVQLLVETDAKFGAQEKELNIALSALGLLWTISDFVRRKSAQLSPDDSCQLWLVLYNCVSELCVDPRPPVRKSACQTLLQTVAAHGGALNHATWQHMVWKVLFPMLDKVRALTRAASTQRADDSSALGAVNLLVHHSRDTAAKQWAETNVQTLSGVVKIFNVQRATLAQLSDFPAVWSSLLQYISYSAACDNSEVSLAALKSLQELLLGKVSAQTLDLNTRSRSTSVVSAGTQSSTTGDEMTPQLPEQLWILSWQAWMRIARALITPKVDEDGVGVTSASESRTLQDASAKSPQHPVARPILSSTVSMSTSSSTRKVYIPGPSHLTTIAHIFPPLFDNVRARIPLSDMRDETVFGILRSLIAVPLSTEQAPFILPTSADITPTQEAVLDCVRVMYMEMIESQSHLRPALPGLFRVLLDFSLTAIRAPPTDFPGTRRDCPQWALQNMIPFAELSLRTVVEYYGSTAHYAEIVQSTVLVDIVKCLAQPMALKYQCVSQSTWKAAASALITVIRLGIPIARQQVRLYQELWPELADLLEKFLFNASRPSTPLNCDERKRHEFIDCQLIELIRNEILPYASVLPRDFIQRIIELLNRGSIATADHHDVIALDSYQQRSDLSRACFDALLSMSQVGSGTIGSNVCGNGPDIIRGMGIDVVVDQQPTGVGNAMQHLGSAAITSLLHRCKQVMTSFVRDALAAGTLRLPQERQLEMIAVNDAVCTLIDSVATRRPQSAAHDAHAVRSDFYAQLVHLYPTVVECVPACKTDKQVEAAVMGTLKAYQTLLLLKVHQ